MSFAEIKLDILYDKFIKIIAKSLHVFEKQDSLDYAKCTSQELVDVSEGYKDRYLNDAVFHAKVQAIVCNLMHELTKD